MDMGTLTHRRKKKVRIKTDVRVQNWRSDFLRCPLHLLWLTCRDALLMQKCPHQSSNLLCEVSLTVLSSLPRNSCCALLSKECKWNYDAHRPAPLRGSHSSQPTVWLILQVLTCPCQGLRFKRSKDLSDSDSLGIHCHFRHSSSVCKDVKELRYLKHKSTETYRMGNIFKEHFESHKDNTRIF